MTLDKKALDKAVEAYHAHGDHFSSVEAAINAYYKEIFKSVELVALPPPPQPQRDYRKELWIGVFRDMNNGNGGSILSPGECEGIANDAVARFDRFFGEVKQ